MTNFHPAISAAAHHEIQQRLLHAEQEHEVKILYAIESGSRAWGFHSPDSDYDVRFVYVRPQDWYLSIDVEDRRDVIEYPIVDEIDINGWDLRKALRLQAKSNPAIVEWLNSPIVYREQGRYAVQARQLLAQHYNKARGFYHYRSTAKTHFQQFLQGEQVRLKKYLYVLRPLLAVRWIEQFGGVAPIEFERLRQALNETSVQQAIDALLLQKRQHGEAEAQPAVPVLQAWIKSELERLQHVVPAQDMEPVALANLNQLFSQLLYAQE